MRCGAGGAAGDPQLEPATVQTWPCATSGGAGTARAAALSRSVGVARGRDADGALTDGTSVGLSAYCRIVLLSGCKVLNVG